MQVLPDDVDLNNGCGWVRNCLVSELNPKQLAEIYLTTKPQYS